jgi:hypothetical protein
LEGASIAFQITLAAPPNELASQFEGVSTAFPVELTTSSN